MAKKKDVDTQKDVKKDEIEDIEDIKKDETDETKEDIDTQEDVEEDLFFKIKVLKNVVMHNNLKIYKEIEDYTPQVYQKGDIILQVNSKYKKRFEKEKNLIEILK